MLFPLVPFAQHGGMNFWSSNSNAWLQEVMVDSDNTEDRITIIWNFQYNGFEFLKEFLGLACNFIKKKYL